MIKKLHTNALRLSRVILLLFFSITYLSTLSSQTCDAGVAVESCNLLCNDADASTITNATADYDNMDFAGDGTIDDYELGYVYVPTGNAAPSSQADVDGASYVEQANADDGSDDGSTYTFDEGSLAAGCYDVYPFISVQTLEDNNFVSAASIADPFGGSESYVTHIPQFTGLNNTEPAASVTINVSINSFTDLNGGDCVGSTSFGGGTGFVEPYLNGQTAANNVASTTWSTDGPFPIVIPITLTDIGAYNADDELFININTNFTISGDCTNEPPQIGVDFEIDFDVSVSIVYNTTFPTIAEGTDCSDFGTPTTICITDPITYTPVVTDNCAAGTYTVAFTPSGGAEDLSSFNSDWGYNVTNPNGLATSNVESPAGTWTLTFDIGDAWNVSVESYDVTNTTAISTQCDDSCPVTMNGTSPTSPPTYTAVATCNDGTNDAAEGEFFIEISSVSVTDFDVSLTGATNGSGTVVTTADETSATPIILGPFSHSGTGTNNITVSVVDNTNTSCPTEVLVSEAICGFEPEGLALHGSGVDCDCSLAEGLRGSILAQAAPGSFDPATTTMVYVLTESDGTIITSNNTGLFEMLADEDYQVHAYNVLTTELTAFTTALGMVTDINNFTFTGCSAACGPASFTVDCPMFFTMCPTDLDLGTFTCTDALPVEHTVMIDGTDITVENGNANHVIEVGDDPCGTIQVSVNDDVAVNFCAAGGQTITRTVTVFDDLNSNGALDAGEESSDCVFTYTIIQDTTPPNIDCPADVTLEGCSTDILEDETGLVLATGSLGAFTTLALTDSMEIGFNNVFDNCSIGSVGYFDAETDADLCTGTGINITRTFVVVDGCGTMVNGCVQLIVIEDTTPPTIDCTNANDFTVECGSTTIVNDINNWLATSETAILAAVGTTDACGGTLDISNDYDGSSVPTLSCAVDDNNLEITFTVVDDCGNAATCTKNVFMDDNTPPTIDCSGLPDLTVECGSADIPAQINNWMLMGGSISASDVCGAGVVITDNYDDASIPTLSCDLTGGNLVITFTATDNCGNAVTCTKNVFMEDTTPPTFTCPADVTIECTASTAVANTGDVTDEADTCDTGIGQATFSDAVSSDDPCAGSSVITRTWTLTDACNNTTTCDQIITLEDSTGPTFTCPADVTIECTASTAVADTGDVTDEADTCDTTIGEATFSDAVSSDDPCAGSSVITRTWTLTDACNNTTTCDQIITLEDTTPPTFTCPADVTIECTASTAVADTGDVTDEADTCDTTIGEATFSDAVSSDDPCAGSSVITRTWTLTDACNNTTTCDQIITLEDTTPPTFTCPADVTIECTASTAVADTGDVTDEADACDTGIGQATFSDAVSSDDPCAGSSVITRTWTLTDACNNTTTCDQIITLEDTTPPTFTCPADVTIECTASTAVADTGDVTDEADTCDTTIGQATFSDAVSSDDPCAGSSVITRTWTLTDACNNTTTCDQIITLEDTTPPTFTCPADVTIECTASTAVADTGDVTDEADTCDTGIGQATFSDAVSSDDPCAGSSVITRTWTLTDACNNTTTCDQIITLEDTTPPTFTCPADVTIECTASTAVADTGDVTDEADTCDTTIGEATFSDAVSSDDPCAGSSVITRTWTLTDACNNTTTCDQIITLEDTTPPTFTCPADVTIECTASTAVGNTGDVTDEADACDTTIGEATFSDALAADTPCAGSSVITRTWTLTDACNNTTTCDQIITLEDSTGPTFTCPADVTIECTASTDIADTGDVTDEADACDTTIGEATFSDVVAADTPCAGSSVITRTWTLTDACNNTTTCDQIITLEDTTAPEWTPTACANIGTTTISTNTTDCDAIMPDLRALAILELSDNCTTPLAANITQVPAAGSVLTAPATICDGTDPSAYTVEVTFTFSDDCGNAATPLTCADLITVQDNTIPTAVCQNFNLVLDICNPNPTVITPADIDNGSSDNCTATTDLVFALSQTDFTCADEGDNIVMMSVTDQCGNVGTCQATVTVSYDKTPPLTTNAFHCAAKDYSAGSVLTAKCPDVCAGNPAPTVNWYATIDATTPMFTGEEFDPVADGGADEAAPGCYTFYAECEYVNGCVSDRTPAIFQVIDCDMECADGCEYYLILEDAGFDGWDAASIDVSINEATPTNYKLDSGDCLAAYTVIPIQVTDGATIDIAYWNGANEADHAWQLVDASFDVVLSTGYDADGCNTVVPTIGVNGTERAKADCPTCCIAEDEFIVRITMGTTPEEQSWELYEGTATSQGPQVVGVNATAYTDLAPGTQVTYTVSLDKCATYTFAAFDSGNNDWNSGSWELIGADLNYGTEITNTADALVGNSLILTSTGVVSDNDRTTFTLPCQNCWDEPINVSGADIADCLWSGNVSVNEPFVCYPNCNHATPTCLQDELLVLVLGDPTNVEIISLDASNYDLGVDLTDLAVGCHKLVQRTTYCDGVITKCTTDLNIVQDANPTMTCNDLLHISLDNATSSTDDCATIITPDMLLEMPNFCEGEYVITIIDENGNSIGNEVNAAHAGQTLTYTIQHKFSDNSCWGEILVEDKQAPIIQCTPYDVACNHPEILDVNWSHSATFSPAMELPANVAGGILGAVSNTFIPVDVPCGALGEVVQSFEVHVDLNHSDLADLSIKLHSPASLGEVFDLAINGQVAATNVFVPSPASVPALSVLLRKTCAEMSSVNTENFITETTGMEVPSNFGNTWYIQIIDSDATIGESFGGGEVTAASITMTCGFPTPYQAFDCTLESVEMIDEQIVDTNCDQSDWNGAQIIRTWQAKDAFGHSSTCTQVVNLKAPTFDDLVWPGDASLECGETPDVTQTGSPMFGCFPITTELHSLCDILFTYEDVQLPTCGGSYKIIRTWTALNCCSNVSQNYAQVIKVEDTEGPVINVADIAANTAIYDCDGSIQFNEAVTDGCSGVESVIVSYVAGGGAYSGSETLVVVDVTNGGTISNLPLGVTELLIEAQDGCLNTTEEMLSISISDNTVPIAICNDNFNVSLGSDGAALIAATDIDEGSFDNCGIASLEVRRVGGCLGNTAWAATAPVDCCDIGTGVAIELRVTDNAGNTNVCWQTVNVEDAIAPTISCAPDKTITCDDPAVHDPFSGEPAASDNCSVELTYVDGGSLDQCIAGTLTRTWTATDGSDKSDDARCTQRITVEHVSDFIVQFPADVTLTDCTLQDTGAPTLTDDDCELLAINSDDVILDIVEDACYKIERTWTIINWCIYDQGNAANSDLGIPQPLPRTYQDDDGYFTYVQTIKVLDSGAPLITCPGNQVFDDQTEGCEGEATLVLEAQDACSPDAALEYTYKIDAFNDGSFDIVANGNDASGVYPYGTHLIKWTVEDGCGNTSLCSYEFTIRDDKNPTPVCLNGISTPGMNSDGCVEIWANDVLEYAFDNCSSDEYVEATVRIRRVGDTTAPQTAITLCCAEGLGPQLIEVWVEDEAGNADYCTTYVDLQDPNGICDDGNSGGDDSRMIAGSIATEAGDMVEAVNVDIEGSNGMNATQVTAVDGHFAFSELTNGMDYMLTPSKDVDPLNGVSTYDLVLMSQHILGVNEFTSPYQMLAGDVNNDGNITTFDVVQTRQLILYVIQDFPTNTSWRFVDADYTFPVLTNPWFETFPEIIDILNLNQNEMMTDFVAIKVGDVSGDARANSITTIEERTEGTLQFNLEETELLEGTSTTVDFRAADFANIKGYQFTLNFDATAMEFTGVEAGALAIGESNLGLSLLNEGVLTSSWNSARPNEELKIADDAILFSLTFDVVSDVLLSEAIRINSRYTKAEAYSDGNVMDVAIAFNSVDGTLISTNVFELYQNTPNPFSNTTTIGFTLPTASTATLKIYDVTGKVLKLIDGDFDRGYNEVKVNRNDVNAVGVIYYQLDTPLHTSTKKMIVLE